MHEQLAFCLEEGYPMLKEHVGIAIDMGTPTAIRMVINACVKQKQMPNSHSLEISFATRIRGTPNENSAGVWERQEIKNYYEELKHFGIIRP
jgi:hypothetical protein